MVGLSDWISDFRNRLVSDPEFRRRAQKIPLFQYFVNRQGEKLFSLINGFIGSQVVLACLEGGLLGLLEPGPQSLEEIADKTGLDPVRAERLLSAASALQLLERRRSGDYALGPQGAALCNNPGLVALIRHHDALYQDLRKPWQLVSTSDAPSRLQAYWSYAGQQAATDAESARTYSALMSESQGMIAEQVLEAYSFKNCQSLLDIGGGNGTFAIAVAKRWPHLKITLADLPDVVPLAEKHIQQAGLAGRIQTQRLDFKKQTIPASYDAVSLVRVLHDHDDETVHQLLASVRQSLSPGKRIVVAEPLAGSDRSGRLNDTYFSIYLLAMGQGRPRTFATLSSFLSGAGFDHIRRHRTSMPLVTSVIGGQAS